MRAFHAILLDAFREALDRKLLVVLLLLTALPIIFCAGIAFEREPVETTLDGIGTRLNWFSHPRGGGRVRRRLPAVKVAIAGVTPVADDNAWPAAVRGGHVLDLAFPEPTQLDALVGAVQEFLMGRRERANGAAEPAAATVEEKLDALKARFAWFGFNHVHARSVPDDPARFLVAVKGDWPHEIRGAHTMSILFGAVGGIPLSAISIAEVSVRLQQGLSGIFAGLLGMVIAIMATASFVPSMLQKGTLDLTLARPVGRVRLLLAKYVGGLWFIALFSTVLVGGCFAALSFATGYANPWFLLSAATIVLMFAVLYSVSVLAGVLTRSSGLAALAALGVWGLSGIVVGLHHTIRMMLFGVDLPRWLVRTIEILYAVLPKTRDIAILNTYALARSHLSPEAFARTFGRELPPVDWVMSLGSTAIFTACTLAAAAWFFARRDY